MARAKADNDKAPSMFDDAPASKPAPADTKAARVNPTRKLMVMDGHAMVYRAWFALRDTRPFTVR
ncbi:MAG: hypothetical protein V3S98_10330, partial [Dehalococcoidia bacterium]